MGNYLTDKEISEAKRLLTLYYSLPYGTDMPGAVWEQIFARIKGGKWSGKRDNRPEPDVIVSGVRYSVKTEKLDHDITRSRTDILDFIGTYPDLIVARPPIDESLTNPEDLHDLEAGQLGTLVLRAHNRIVTDNWDRMSVLFRLRERDFIYWEFPAPCYDPEQFSWKDTGKAKGQSRNIMTDDTPATFKWTSRGSQFYVRYRIPADADIFSIAPRPIDLDDLLVFSEVLEGVENVSAFVRQLLAAAKR